MHLDEFIYSAFLEEMQYLENFRERYSNFFTDIPLENDDPDIKRLIESMAVFSARTRLAGKENISRLHKRIFSQICPFLSSPLPATGLLKINPHSIVEPVEIEKNTGLIVTTESGDSAYFRTLYNLEVFPFTVSGLECQTRSGNKPQIVISLDTYVDISKDIGKLSFYLNYLNSYVESLTLQHYLKHSLKELSVSFDDSDFIDCEFSIGAPEKSHDDCHPIEKERLFFHFPEQSLYLNINLCGFNGGWSNMKIILDLDSPLPADISLNKDIFQLFVVPIENLRSEKSEPILIDGTKTRYPIYPPKLEENLKLHSVNAVYKTEKNTMIPVRPGILSGNTDSYELEYILTDKGVSQPYINANMPGAFEENVQVVIDGLWFKPSLSENLWQKLTVQPNQLNVPGLEWKIAGKVIPHSEIQFKRDSDVFLKITSLKHNDFLNLEELIFLLDLFSSVWGRDYAIVRDLMLDLEIEKHNQSGNGNSMGSSTKLTYNLSLKKYGSIMKPLIDSFMEHANRILRVWIPFTDVEIRGVVKSDVSINHISEI